jgi:hypothetical protein
MLTHYSVMAARITLPVSELPTIGQLFGNQARFTPKSGFFLPTATPYFLL